MRSQGRSNKRHNNRGNKAEEHNALPDDRSWASHADYRQPQRASYTDSSSSRLHHDSESWGVDSQPSVYAPNDIDFRPSENWSRSAGESHRIQPRETWPQHTPPWASSYPQPGWNRRNSASHDDRNPSYGSWPRDDSRIHSVDDHRHDDDRAFGREKWRNDHRAGRGWQNDSEWDSRRRDDATHAWDEPKRSSHDVPVEDRSWEPAASWKASNRNESQAVHNYPVQRHNHSQKSTRPAKQPYSQNRQRERDWRHDDDGHFNNWQKRDHRSTAELPGHKHRSSYSRSRSPAESHYSRFSSRGRSKSRSLSPAYKRRKREPSPSANPSPFSPGRGRYHSSPQQPTLNTRGRSTSTSSRSSVDGSPGSTSQFRAVHRLPTASDPAPISDISRPTNHARNGKSQANGRHNKRSNTSRKQNAMPPPSSVPMPLPSFLPAKPNFEMPDPDPLGSMHVFPESKSDQSPPHSAPVKISTGFRPINFVSSASSSLRKFFPGDDDDVELVSTPVVPVQDQIPVQEPDPPRLPLRSPQPLTPPRPPANTRLHDDISVLPSPADDSRQRSATAEATVPPEEPSPQVEARGELYTIVSQVGEGTFGKVYKARNTVTNMHVALKRIRMEAEKDGFPVTAMREIKLLQSLRHANVIDLYEMMVSHGTAYMVFEYMDHDLTGILSQSQFSFSPAHLKSLCHQMLAGLAYLHHKGVIHRDIKGSNILINNRGELKLADFGLARFYQKRRRTDYTNRVITLWYRSPELLFGATEYGPEVDMWSAGCIMLELFTKKPVFQGNDEIHQLDVIYKVIGSPTPERWPGMINLPWYELVKPKDVIPDHFRGLFQKWMTSAALDLAQQLLSYDPGLRWTAIQAMEAPYFLTEQPPAERPTGLANLEGEWHELETKRERAKKRKKE